MTRKEIKDRVNSLGSKTENCGGFFDIPLRKEAIADTQKKLLEPGVWNDIKKARELSKKLNSDDEIVKRFEKISDDLCAVSELSESLEDEDLEEISNEIEKIEEEIGEVEMENALNGEEDRLGAIMTVHPGAGGTESCDWAGMLLKMYIKYFEKHDWKFKVIDIQEAEEAGIKDATLEIDHEGAYGFLKCERGIHRLVRISPFDANHRRHTSFVSVFVYPLADDEIEVEILEKDLKLDFFRSSGPGGQNVNKVSTAVRITHIPTGIVVQSQSERSQILNRQNAMKILKSKIYQKMLEEEQKKKSVLENQKTDIAWGHQIRSYVFTPYTQVKDHRTDFETSDVQKVMDGNIDAFIRNYLLYTGKK
ncbi:peptide chain release factor 2 [candidate division WOR-3 bacterium]|nr:peptide chain release factor 2 [candidate division WOR-3 bacterium]